MEHKIGEIFEYNGEWYQCVKGDCCRNCDFYDKFKDDICFAINYCDSSHRSDKTSIIFKKLEKVGEPFIGKVHIQLQRYKIYTEPIIDPAEKIGYVNEKNTIAIEIKQTKEDMEENKVQHYDCFFDKEQSKSNLKPFDLEAAKAGKPVCTRDGRKARIICFDRKDNTPIVALIECVNHTEILQCVHNDGKCSHYDTSDNDLMMPPEKKEGWVNVYKRGNKYTNVTMFETEKRAKSNVSDDYVATVKIEWEE